MRVVIYCKSMRNVFVDAWVRTWQAAGAAVAVLVGGQPPTASDMPSWLRRLTWFSEPDESRCAVTAIEDLLGGSPDVVFYWWGLQAMDDPWPLERWPRARAVLSVDTFPNAARFATELRERVRSRVWLKRVDGLVLTSDQMAHELQRLIPSARRLPSVVVDTPFPLSAHGDAHPRTDDDTLRYCFTGRSDFLFDTGWRMAKDNVASTLLSLVATGAQVDVRRPKDELHAARLTGAGLGFYDEFSREALLDGRFARMVSGYHAQLAIYNVTNATIRRRISTGLSTRFALGLCSSAPIVVPSGSAFAESFFESTRIGFSMKEPHQLSELVREAQSQFRNTWREEHTRWAGDAYGERLIAIAAG